MGGALYGASIGGSLGALAALVLTKDLDGENRFFTLLILGIGGAILGGALGFAIAGIKRQGGVKMSTETPSVPKGFGGANAGVLGGGLMILAAVAWFVVGLFLMDRIYLYPPVLFVLGLISIFRGVVGND